MRAAERIWNAVHATTCRRWVPVLRRENDEYAVATEFRKTEAILLSPGARAARCLIKRRGELHGSMCERERERKRKKKRKRKDGG